MAILKETYCRHCGTKAGLLTRKKLSDGNYICTKCTSAIPKYIRDCLNNYTYEDFVDLLECLERSEKEIKPIFRADEVYGFLCLDTKNGYFCYDSKLFGKKYYFPIEDVDTLTLTFQPETLKEGLIFDSVKGNVQLTLGMHRPYFYISQTMLYGQKASADVRKGLFREKITYDVPKGMNEFMDAFNRTQHQFMYRDRPAPLLSGVSDDDTF